MSADGGARGRRWVASLPVLVALLFATTTLATTFDGDATGGSAPVALHVAHASVQQASGPRPDVPVVVKRGGSWAAAPDVGLVAWAAARASTVPTLWWVRRSTATGRHGDPQRDTYQGRGPPATA